MDDLLLSPLLLSRIQFGFVITFHILFPAFTIGLASWLAFVEWRWLRTRDTGWRDLYFFWLKIFAVSFAMGVVSGIVMSFQFGTNWAVFSARTGNILGPLLSYEVLTAFFLEATFLGVMLFGWGRVSEHLHFLATGMVALGTLLSTFWIITAKSWMQTPAGYVIDADGVFVPTSWWAVIFNPSFPYRLAHMVLAAYITTCFVIGGISAWYLRRRVHVEAGRRMLKFAVAFAALAVPLQIFVGDLHGLNVGEYQPTKLAAMEGYWRHGAPGEGVPLVLFAIPDAANERNRAEIKVPHLGSVILTRSWDGEIPPLTAVPASERPPVAPVFYAFRIMVGLGVLMYVLLDGFVLGLGILAPFAEDGHQLDHMMNTAAPIWDGNETWLVLGGAGLLAAFPKAYALVLSALYLPVLLMLIALVFRGVAFEFRFKARRGKPFWGAASALGSLCTAFAQGLILGALVDGIPLQEGKYVGGMLLNDMFSWFSRFSMLTAVALVFGYALLGSTWLILKTEGRLQQVARMLTRPLVLVVVAFMGRSAPGCRSSTRGSWRAGSRTGISGGRRRCRCWRCGTPARCGARRSTRGAMRRRSCWRWASSCSASSAWCSGSGRIWCRRR